MHAGSRMLPPKRFVWDQGQGKCLGAAWGKTQGQEALPWGHLPGEAHPHPSLLGKGGPNLLPLKKMPVEGQERGLPSACCFLLSPRVLAFGEARSSSSMAMICPRLGCAWSFWVSLMLGDIPKPLGQICSLSERGSKPATSYAGWAKVVSGKLFPPSAEFFSLQKRT